MEAERFFFKKYMQDDNVEYNRIKDAIENNNLTKVVDDLIEDKQEIMELLKNDELKYSNQTICDSVIREVYKNTELEELKEIIKCSYVGFLQTDKMGASAWRQFYDGSYLTVIGEYTYFYLDEIGEIMVTKYLKSIEGLVKNSINYEIIDKLLNLNINEKDINKKEIKFYELIKKLEGISNFDDDYVRLSCEVLYVALAFVIGHEYGHHILRHLKNDNIYMKLNINDDRLNNIFNEVNQLNDMCKKELDADRFAIVFVNEYLRGYNDRGVSTLQMSGILVSIIFLAIGSKNLSRNSDSHPSVQVRYYFILQWIEKLYGSSIVNEMKDIMKWFCEDTGYYTWEEQWWNL